MANQPASAGTQKFDGMGKPGGHHGHAGTDCFDQGPWSHLLTALIGQETHIRYTPQGGQVRGGQVAVDETDHAVHAKVGGQIWKLAPITLPLAPEDIGMGLTGDHVERLSI